MEQREGEEGSKIPGWVWLLAGIIILFLLLMIVYSFAGDRIVQAIPNQT